jgi:Fe-S-cluster containining protein
MKNKKIKPKIIDANLKLKIGNEELQITLSVPESKTNRSSILPFARELTNKAVDIAVNNFTKDGKTISCAKGCGACCVQLVPISDTEAREITKLIKTYSKEKKEIILDKFETAKKQLTEAGLWETLSQPQNINDEQINTLGLKYFAQQIPCPFLEDGACSIHQVRPLSCREFLVTSPAIHCSNPNEKDVVTFDIPQRISNALGALGEADPNFISSWIPLIIAPFWAQLHPKQPINKTGPQWVEELLSKIN